MSNTTKKRSRSGAGQISEAAWAFLNDALTDEIGAGWERWGLEADQPVFLKGPSAADLWMQYSEVVLARWRDAHPGSRPSLWWRFNAPRMPHGVYPGCFWDGVLPVPRVRVGGVGSALQEVSAHVPRTYLGVPIDWPEPEDDPQAPIIAIDRENPPLFESQASYLERFDLLGTAERRRLVRNAFDPESLFDILDGRRELAGDGLR
jgi:hypothetical protein